MKVICINGVKLTDKSAKGFSPRSEDLIYEGSVYTVVKEDVVWGEKSYRLRERKRFWYKKSRFIPVSNICEIELSKEREAILM